MTKSLPFYSASDEADLLLLSQRLKTAYASASKMLPATDEGDTDDDDSVTWSPETFTLAPSPDLIGIDPAVYRQLEAAIKAGKRHIMLYGPPGTGKTELARYVAASLHHKWRMITGSSDWTSQDIIGGYQPIGEGKIGFQTGILLREFDRPLIIDELNRCDIDKVIGPLFTVLSGQSSTLPYRVDVSDEKSEQYVILPQPKPERESYEFAPTDAWRIIATINTIDKASLYQMSYALSRRFAWIYVGVPQDLSGFAKDFLAGRGISPSFEAQSPSVIPAVWAEINKVREIGAAPIIDAIKTALIVEPTLDFFSSVTTDSQRVAYLDGLNMFVLPMLDGVEWTKAEQLGTSLCVALGINEGSDLAKSLFLRLRELSI
ncbi:AAA family ATPase [Devosia neptuniae]|uniref:AAA family ATPase n=1 Tax=Devosia neptuniae TaxID=191302 RepID=UPI0022B0499D|nr:AAA family ATPase [Devosia neptuniae]MCZ4346439.1 AAA family ATPase [Devosia neptuniae]